MGAIGLALLLLAFVVCVLVVGALSPQQTTETSIPKAPSLPPLPERSSSEVDEMFGWTAANWVEYPGRTPPLRLKIRGLSEELFRRVARKHVGPLGRIWSQRAALELTFRFENLVMAEAYVLDWEGATYPNGAPMLYSPENLAAFMATDPHLVAFIRQEAHRLSPKWSDLAS